MARIHANTTRVGLSALCASIVAMAASTPQGLTTFENEAVVHKETTGVVPEAGNGSDGAFGPSFSNGACVAVAGSDVVLNADCGPFQFTTVDIPAGITVRGIGTQPLVILCQGDVKVAGRLDVSGEPGSRPSPGSGGPGGGDGGAGGTSGPPAEQGNAGSGRGGGGGGSPTNSFGLSAGGGGGGGFGNHGISGGSGAFGNGTPGAGGAPYGSPALVPLRGGSGGGGGGGDAIVTTPPGAGGGGGGGALLISTPAGIEILGSVLANGGDGGPGYSDSGNGGGGSGGGIRLFASSVSIFGEVRARGGAGGTQQYGGYGGDGGGGRIAIIRSAPSGAYPGVRLDGDPAPAPARLVLDARKALPPSVIR